MKATAVLAAACLFSLVPAAGAQEPDGVMATPYGGSFDTPIFATAAPGQPDLLYVVERSGTVQIVDHGTQLSEPFLDISDLVTTHGEGGLLSIAFPPDYEESGLIYAYYTNHHCNDMTGGCGIEIGEFRRSRSDPLKAKASTHRTVIEIPHKEASNHNGGTAMFGPDGKLWLATGDGGSGNDAFDNASRKNRLLGKLIRINPREPVHGKSKLGYRIPRRNPFVGVPGRDEIWSIGLRNPFRFSFEDDVIAIGDVGQGAREEVDIVTIATARGANFGWPSREGDTEGPHPERPGSGPLLEPIHAYPRPVNPPDGTLRGVTVNGGVFVDDTRLEGTVLDPGHYVFGETFTAPNIRSFIPDVGAQTITGLQGHPFGISQPVAFTKDLDNRTYVVSLNGNTVYRLDPTSAAARRGDSIGNGKGEVDLQQVGGTFDTPVNAAFAPGETNKVYVVEQDGTARVVVNGSTESGPFLDITNLTNGSGEQGFLGMAFHPDYQTNHLVYAYYNDDENGDIVVSEFEATDPLDADESSEREVIRIRHRFASNHNGGQLVFGPDGYLYFGTGDGGGGGDPREHAQNKNSLLGKLIRIDPLESGGDPYTAPPGNPFIGRKGNDAIYAMGLRNPFRFNFEPDTGNIQIGDVGQDRFEEVDVVKPSKLAGANFGWDRYEGFKRFKVPGDKSARKPRKKNHTRPVLAYNHSNGASVIGGLVVHDPSLTNLFGRYLFTDFFSDRFRSFVPKTTRVRGGYKELDTEIRAVSAFAEDPATREVYAVSRGDSRLYRLEPAQ